MKQQSNEFESKKNRSKNTLDDFLLSLLATTISIVLTFGTSTIIAKHQKEAAKREMVMMIIYDFDKTIDLVQHADSVFYQAYQAQQEVALHPEHFDNLRTGFLSTLMITKIEFAETTEKIFSTNIETFNTLGNVNFVQEVSDFYNTRHTYKETVLDEFEKEVTGSGLVTSITGLLSVNFPTHYFNNKQCLLNLRKIRNRCMQMMKVSEKELKEFSQQRSVVEDNGEEEDSDFQQIGQEYIEAEIILGQARENLEQDKQ